MSLHAQHFYVRNQSTWITPTVCAASPHRHLPRGGRQVLPPPLRGISLGEGGKHSHRPCGAPPSWREASTPSAPAGHLPHRGRQVLPPSQLCRATLLAAPRQCGAEENRAQSQRRTLGFSSPSRHCRSTALAKKISQKDFLRRGAASVLSAAFGAVEPPARRAPPRRRQFGKNL